MASMWEWQSPWKAMPRIVEAEPDATRPDVDVMALDDVVDGRVRIVRPGRGVDGQRHGHVPATPDQARGLRRRVSGREVVERPQLVIGAPAAPVADLLEDAFELGHVDARWVARRAHREAPRAAIGQVATMSSVAHGDDLVVEIEGGPDLGRHQVDLGAQGGRRAVGPEGGVLVAHGHLPHARQQGHRRSVLHADAPAPDVQHRPIRVAADDRAPHGDRACEGQAHAHQLRLHDHVDAGLQLGHHRIEQRLGDGRRARGRHDLDRRPRLATSTSRVAASSSYAEAMRRGAVGHLGPDASLVAHDAAAARRPGLRSTMLREGQRLGRRGDTAAMDHARRCR